MGRSGAAFLVTCLLSSATAMSAEPERPCPACKHGMARAEGPVAGAADYLCRFCEVAVHVRPDGREAVSYRIQGERREFDLLGDARLRFPLPGTKAPANRQPNQAPNSPESARARQTRERGARRTISFSIRSGTAAAGVCGDVVVVLMGNLLVA